jgi:hypothetical protein
MTIYFGDRKGERRYIMFKDIVSVEIQLNHTTARHKYDWWMIDKYGNSCIQTDANRHPITMITEE